MNLPNSLTLGRIAATPAITALIMNPPWQYRLSAWVLFVVAAVTDYYDGKLARSRNLVTRTGKLLDPIADKALLIATLVPIYWLTRDVPFLAPLDPERWTAGVVGPVTAGDPSHVAYPFVTPMGLVPVPLWVVAVILGRELFMTFLRQHAARRGVVISAIGPAKLKTTFQNIWVGTAFFWFFAASAAAQHRWDHPAWDAFAHFNGIVGTIGMVAALGLTLYSLGVYLRRYGGLLVGGAK
ncbi:MAG TPA: CDP-alcohol phosphatidyltransferase family protein [Gemmatimonadaceae bacterium]|nr:CDP-alcohol phosphatidyltransferase family protein [Gemmatimonadaceae bacterium]